MEYKRDLAAMIALVSKETHITAYPWPEENLNVYTFWVGPRNAQNVLVVISGTHGVEGPAGAMVQKGLLSTNFSKTLNSRTALLLIFALNPWGYLHSRRVDHNNVDVNRGCGEEFKTRCPYGKYAGVFQPTRWNKVAMMDVFYAMSKNPQETKRAASGGQYDWPRGIFYGGNKLCISGKILREICSQQISPHARRVAVLDIHTGLGEYAVASIISAITEKVDRRKYQKWLGPCIQFPNLGESISSPITGDILSALSRWLPGKEVLSVALEMGTGVPPQESLPTIIAENYVWHNPGVLPRDEEKEIYRKFIEIFWRPDDLFWQGAIWSRAISVIEQQLAFLRS